MIYDTRNALEAKQALERIKFLIDREKTFSLEEKKKITRSLPQNKYLHLILSWFALEYGETMEYIKQEVFKKEVNKDLFSYVFVNKKTGEIRTSYKSITDLDNSQITLAIDRFRDYASKNAGIYLPEPKDLAFLDQIQTEIIKNQLYL